MKFALLLTAFASPLLALAAIDDGDEPDAPLLRGAGAVVASDAEDTGPSFGIPDFLAQPKYCSKSCYKDCSCYSSSNDCYPKCCTKSKGNCPNAHMPPCDPPNENRDPPKFDKNKPDSCPGNNNDDDDDDDDNGDRHTRCDDNSDCNSSEFCNLADCEPNGSGRCMEGGSNNNGCGKNLDRVCGCDQRTYDNKCLAENYGMSLDSTGSCTNNNRDQGDLGKKCTKNSNCSSGYYCKPLFGECSTKNRDGFCTRIPRNKDECKDVPNDQVCACNGNTEKNECRAEYNSQGVRSYGSCDGDDDDDDNGDRDTRCWKSTDCSSSQYCKFARGDCNPNSQGRCTEGGRGKKGCNKNLDPVCGCDERDYDNECEAERYGVTIDYTGKCSKSGRTQGDFDGTCKKNSDCRSGYYCKPLFGLCSTNKRDGFCVKYPVNKDNCEKYPHDKVCGCDRVTDINECRAEYERVGVDYRGSCNDEDKE